MTTKRELIGAAFRQIGLASYSFDIAAEEMQDAMYDLRLMMTDWSNAGLHVGFDFGNNDLDDAVGSPDAVDPVITYNLAVLLAPASARYLRRVLRPMQSARLTA